MWSVHLPWVLLGLRAAQREDDKISPAQAVFSTPIVLTGQFLEEKQMLMSLIFTKIFLSFSFLPGQRG
jgi:hypothetical protein